ncbi:hypothetical protein TELCIR_19228, partial [Teladorsagia circumcincta]
LLEELDMELVFVRRFPEALQHWRTTGMGLLSRMQALEPYPAKNGAKLSADEAEYEVAKELLKTLEPSESPHIGTLSKSEWEAFCMYLLFAFRKKDGPKSKSVPEHSAAQSSECKNVPEHSTAQPSDNSQEKCDEEEKSAKS